MRFTALPFTTLPWPPLSADTEFTEVKVSPRWGLGAFPAREMCRASVRHTVSSIQEYGFPDSQEYLRDFQTLGFPSKILIGLWYAPVITTDLGSYNVVKWIAITIIFAICKVIIKWSFLLYHLLVIFCYCRGPFKLFIIGPLFLYWPHSKFLYF